MKLSHLKSALTVLVIFFLNDCGVCMLSSGRVCADAKACASASAQTTAVSFLCMAGVVPVLRAGGKRELR